MSKLDVLIQLLRHDLLKYKREFWSKLFDTSFLLVTSVIVWGYFMPELRNGYGPFILISSIASFGFFDTVGKVNELITDIDGDRKISYTLTLPLPSWLVFVYIGVYWAINSALIAILLFPLGKLMLYNQFDLLKVSYVKLIPMYITINLFYGFFSLWLTSMLKKMTDLGVLWVRVINPIIMFGAFFYSWHSIYQLSPSIAIFDLINPLVYVMEGMRAAALGQEGFISYWICLPALWVYIIACAWHGTSRLQKRLDCVR
jgi:ABC-2 type transport system permease protein